MVKDSVPKVLLSTRLGAVLGDATAKALTAAFEISDVEGLLRHYPRRYAERGELTDLAQLVPGEHATVMAEIFLVVIANNKAESLIG